jgi:hypothetical protein
MTVEEKIQQLRGALAQLQDSRNYVEMNNRLKLMKRDRIFGEGKDINGNVLTYSTKEIWVSVDKSPRKLTPSGKSRKAEKTAYFPNGYGQFKAAAGRDNRPFFLFSNLQTAYLNSYTIGIDGGRVSLGGVVQSSTNNPSGKIEGLEERYADYFSTSQSERAEMVEMFRKLVLKLL